MFQVLVACAASITYAENHVQTSVSEEGSNDNKGKKIVEVKQTETSGKTTKHDEEFSKKGQDSKDLHKSSHKEKKGKKTSHHAEDSHKSSKHSAGDAKSGLIYASGKKHKKGNYLKGFREKFHKDEEKKHDSFFSNGEKSGEYEVYGKKKSKHATDSFNKDQKKARKNSSSGKSGGKTYKSAKGHHDSDHKSHATQGGVKTHHKNSEKHGKKHAAHGGKKYKLVTIVIAKDSKVLNPRDILFRQRVQNQQSNLVVTDNKGKVLRYGRRRKIGLGKNRNGKLVKNNKNDNKNVNNQQINSISRTQFTSNSKESVLDNANTNNSNHTRISITTNETCTEIASLTNNDINTNINNTNDNANISTIRSKRDTNEVEQSTNSNVNQLTENYTNINDTMSEEDRKIIRIKLRPNSSFNVTYKEENGTTGNLKQSTVIHLKPLPSTLNFTALESAINNYEKKKKANMLLQESKETTATQLLSKSVTENVTQISYELNNNTKEISSTARPPLTLEDIRNTASSLVNKSTKNKAGKRPLGNRKRVQMHENLKTTPISETKMNEYINLLQKVKTEAGPSNASMQINYRDTNLSTPKPKGLKKNRRKPKTVSKHML
ncbi:unnamed protein product [Phyllotreta striolata]|uniref:Uncharacterized protein n=1 Tax=Phyllotreta striolata TaxID=444603 RepID=A0A9N9TH44_PHYSR|nr:unnamed protein product [Phyllotreta striolata]